MANPTTPENERIYDVLPQHHDLWDQTIETIQDALERAEHQKVTVPFGEKEAFFTKKLLQKLNLQRRSDLYIVRRSHKQGLVVSPPGPIGLLRLCTQHELLDSRTPSKLYTYTSTLSYDDEAQDYEQHHVVKSETIGDASAVRDAEQIMIAQNVLKELGFHSITVHINSLGSEECKERYYEKILQEIPEELHEICEQYRNDPVKMFICLQERLSEREDINLPQLIDNLTDTCYEHFKEVLEFLDTLEIPYQLTPQLESKTGFAHKTIFEITGEDGSVLVRGGRHDDLLTEFQAEAEQEEPITGSVGMELKVDRIVRTLAAREEFQDPERKREIFVAGVGQEGQKYALTLVSQVREEGLSVTERLGKKRLKDQLVDAREEGIELIVIAGRKEALDRSVIIRHRSSENQETVDVEQFIPFLYQKLREQNLEEAE